MLIRTTAVLGAGTMGAQIAAHLANAGLPVLLLDVTRQAAIDGLARAAALKPDPFFTAEAATRIRTGGLDQDLTEACRADWVIEAIVERLDLKQALFADVEARRAAATIVSSNSSGIPMRALAEGRGEAFRRHFLGTHFFNPPRYLRLVEVIPTDDTAPLVVDRVTAFVDLRLGKGPVLAKDAPNFIANHLGLYGVMRIFAALATGRFTIEEIDAITGPALGRPKSATFRTLDLTGLDILVDVARNLAGRVAPETAADFAVPPLAAELVARGWIGEKAGGGFYRRVRGDRGSEILTLDPAAMSYRAAQPARLPALEEARGIDDTGARIRALFGGRDRVGAFLRETLGPTLVYAARVAPEVAHSIDDVDRAMGWGYGWELGPFEIADAIGLRALLDATGTTDVPPLIAEQLAAGRDSFRGGDRVPPVPGTLRFRESRSAGQVLKRNAGASLVDLGDGVLGVELHSKMNALGGDTVAMLGAAVKEAEQGFAALVVSTDAVNFSVGANLMLLLVEAQDGNWEEVDLMVRGFQRAMLGLRLSAVPVVVAPAGLTLGGGCELALHGDRVQAAAETYIGLVEAGVGLIPAGGGCKEMVARATAHLRFSPQVDLRPVMQPVFETLGLATVSSSADHARQLGLLREADRVSMNRDRVLADAKALARSLAPGYRPPQLRTAIAVGGAALEAALKLGVHLARRADRITDHDALVGRTLAHVLAGGSLPQAALVSEQYLLDLEREAFLSLCGEAKTRERIAHTLKTGKPLRN